MNFSDMPPPMAPGMSSMALLLGKDIKTVPFLRSLTEMLINNSDLISFVPGEQSNDGTKMPGQIIIHDRNRLQSEVLPFYFNHASFASFRRNLSYFSFVRLGRGRHSGAVAYINESVFELVDILRLKRRAVGTPPGGTASAAKDPAVDGVGGEPQPRQQLNQNGKRARDEPQEPSRDVTSAMISGRMHACETNHDLDDSKKLKYFQSSSMVTSSKSVSAVTLGTKSGAKLSSSKLVRKKKRRSSKNKRSKKGGPRVHRLLHANGIVPFIHLPARLCKGESLQEEGTLKNAHQTQKKAFRGNSSDEENRYKGRGSKKTSGTENSSSNEEGGDVSRHSNARVSSSRKNKSSSESVASALLALRSGP